MSRGSSFVAALRDTVRAVFADDPPDPKELFKLVREHRFSEALELLRSHPQSWHVVDDGGHTLLHWAALGGHVEFGRRALSAGIKADTRSGSDATKQTPLMWAVCGGQTPMAEMLLDAHADPLARDSRGATAMILAVQQERFETLQLLVDRGGPSMLSAGDLNGCTAAHWAAYRGSKDALMRLAALRCDLRAVDNQGMLPLHRAVWAYRPEVVDYLVEHGSDPMRCSREGKNCVDIAEELRNPGLQARLLAAVLRRLLALQPPSRPPSPEHKAKEPGEANMFRELVASTPMAIGVAVSWAEAWAADGSGSDTAPEVPAGAKPPSAYEAEIIQTCTSFDLDYASSIDVLRQALVKHVEDARAILRKELLACFVILDRHGVAVDLLSQSPEELPPDRFPLHARLVGLREVSANELAKLAPVINTGISHQMRADPQRYRNRVLTRIPPLFRWAVWKEVLRLRDRELPRGSGYHELGGRDSAAWIQDIKNDIGRTFTFFDRQQQQCLQRMLNAYAMLNPEVGYCQGMNMIAGLLLLVSNSEEEGFAVLTCLMEHLGLSEFYRKGFPLLLEYLGACDAHMAEAAPGLVAHFAREGVELKMYLQQWFLTLFIDCLPLPLVVTIWDAVICEGLPVAFRVVVTILASLKEPLEKMSFQEIANAFKMMRRHTDKEGDLRAFEAGHFLLGQAARVAMPSAIREHHRRCTAPGTAGMRGSSPWPGPHDASTRCFT